MNILYENPCYQLTLEGEIEFKDDWYEGKFLPEDYTLYYDDISRKYGELLLTNLD